MTSELKYYKKEVAYFMRRLYKKNLTTSGGNISYKFDDDTVLITSSEVDKARIKGKQTGVVKME